MCFRFRSSLSPRASALPSLLNSLPSIQFPSHPATKPIAIFSPGILGLRRSFFASTKVSVGSNIWGSCRNLFCKSAATMRVVSSQDGVSSRLWIKFQNESVFAFFTPFVVCLAAGNLDLETFRSYIAQDVHFLKAFAQAYEMAEKFADDDDAKAVLLQLRKAVHEELKMHDSVVQEWGIDPAQETVPNSATVRYTEFLLATGSGKVEGWKGPARLATPFEKTKIAAYTVGAMTPCMRLYASIGKELLALPGGVESTHQYKKWIDNYSSEGFQALALKMEDLLDKLSVPLTGEELKVIERLYLQAVKLEVEFFSVQPIVQRAVVPLSKVHNPTEIRFMVFSDFDLTCTIVDSSAILAEIAIVTAPKTDQTEPETLITRRSSADMKSTWFALSTQYTAEYQECIESILAAEKVESFNYEDLRKALEPLSDFEKRANSRVSESGVLKGLNLEDIKRAGERLKLQDGCTRFFQEIVEKMEELNADIHILSYCWCGDLIRSSFSAGGLSPLNVHANEFVYDESVSTGEITKELESPMDKLQAFRGILDGCNDNSKPLTVYIGDSVGDLLCMLEADVGIVVGSSASLRRVATQFGISFVPLFAGVVQKQREFVEGNAPWKGLSGVLYTVSSWAEIHAFILGSS